MPSRARRALRWSRRLIAVVTTACALTGAVRLIAPGIGEPAGVRRQLAFLRAALDDGAADQAQRLFPEGHFFHRGWSNWLRGQVLSLQPATRRDPAELRYLASR
ncbi:hypothetical protein [Nonomuraea sp. LPB2021202275-12-8]|uniref:hypothetical protein n=1 Tax=Nonomuraea sp. LPB2021202275-12-8 TaxID=3120159 RepID=UPI00300D25E6